MAEAWFYHLTRSSVEDLLPLLCTRALELGWRVAVRGRDPDQLRALDTRLWLGEGFLPHGLMGGPHDADQPVLLTTGASLPNAAEFLVVIDGAEVSAAEIAPLRRINIVFDGKDEAALDQARGQWKSLTGAGIKAQYWSEEGGRWQLKSESPGA